jgi:hypothetical protein
MEELPTDPGIRALVFGRNDSGKSTFALDYASIILQENPEAACLVFAPKAKTERKPIHIEDMVITDRILYRWVHDRISLMESIARLHLYLAEPLEVLIVEDILDLVHPSQVHPIIGQIISSLSVFPICRLVITTTLRSEVYLSHFRLSMTHYVNIFSGGRRIGVFPKSLKKCNDEIRSFVPESGDAS